MADYITLAEFKTHIVRDLTATDDSLDAALNAAIIATSRAVEHYTGRRFYSTAADETRYVTASDATMLLERDLDIDIISLTSLACDEDGDRTYERTWTATDFDLDPANALLEYKPYTRISVTPNGDYAFPVNIARGVKLVGKFGFCTAANQDLWVSELKQACLIQASRFYLRAVTPMGVAGNSAFGEMRILNRLDPDVELMLGHLVRGIAR